MKRSEFADGNAEDVGPLWVRKRDGGIVPFDESKLASSILAARRGVDPVNAALVAQELTQAALHFLRRSAVGPILDAKEIAEIVVRVLREVDHAATAAAYFDHERERRRKRRDLRVVDPPTPAEAVASIKRFDKSAEWNKADLLQQLIDVHELEPDFAREVAASIERRLLVLDLPVVRRELIVELTVAELTARGVDWRPAATDRCGPTYLEIGNWLDEGLAAETMFRRAGRRAVEEFAIERFYSPDVASLCREQLLEPFDAAAPGHWAAMSVGTLSLAAGCEDVAEFLERLPIEFARVAKSVDGTIAIEAFDAVVSLLERAPANTGNLVDECLRAIERCVGQTANRVILNLHGCIPDGLADALGDGPLFAIRATEQQERLASNLARELVMAVVPAREQFANVALDFHPDQRCDPSELALLLRPYGKHLLTGDRFRFSFDRTTPMVAEGLPLRLDGRMAVYSCVGIRLDMIARHWHVGSDEPTFLERVGWLVDGAVRAASQKREFVRASQPDAFLGRDFDRAAAVLSPIGLLEAAVGMCGRDPGDLAAASAIAARFVASIQRRAKRTARPLRLACRFDANQGGMVQRCALSNVGSDLAAAQREMLIAGLLQQELDGGTLEVAVDSGLAMRGDELLNLVAFAASKTQLRRMALAPIGVQRQSTLDTTWFTTVQSG